MRKRQVKKFAKRARETRDISAYRAAFKGGSRRLVRRMRAFRRHAGPPDPRIVWMQQRLAAIRRDVKAVRVRCSAATECSEASP